VGNDGGDVIVLELATTRRVLRVHEFNQSVDASPVYANGTLYIQTRSVLYAIAAKR
jgi:hypothetical protein